MRLFINIFSFGFSFYLLGVPDFQHAVCALQMHETLSSLELFSLISITNRTLTNNELITMIKIYCRCRVFIHSAFIIWNESELQCHMFSKHVKLHVSQREGESRSILIHKKNDEMKNYVGHIFFC